MSGRRDVRPMAVMVAVALLFAASIYGAVAAGRLGGPGAAASPSPTPTEVPGPVVTIVHEPCCEQAARFLDARWTATQQIGKARFTLDPAPPFECSATVDPSGTSGHFGCVGLLPASTPFAARLALTTAAGTFTTTHRFRTMGDRLTGVRWFSEFEDPKAEPLACAAAAVRMVELYATGKDPMTASQIQQLGRAFNRSRDPGLDPVAIATVLHRLDARNSYHYYRFATREEATASAAYWLVRSGKPVIALSLGGQHAPLVTGFRGSYGTYYDDPNNKIAGVIVQDPQRGDVRQETASFRPDKPRAADYQTGHLLTLEEWYRDEWWLGSPYAATIRYAGKTYDVERSDGAYPTPHWAGKYVLLVDDADGDWPSDKEGRVKWH